MADRRCGRLVVAIAGKGSRGEYLWDCLCDCGGRAVVPGSRLRRGDTSSCGCYRKEISLQKIAKQQENNVLPNMLGSIRRLITTYKSNARRRGLDWCLSEGKCAALFCAGCYYCGSEPKSKLLGYSRSVFYYNGIDRVDNDKGYVESNCVSCCCICNKAKLTMTIDQFVEWIVSAYRNLTKHGITIPKNKGLEGLEI